jgi:type II secretory pathway pseudopilin PulG
MMEVLMVVILIGIIGSMAVPSISRSMTTTRVDRATQTVASDIEAAFSLAARQRKPVLLVIDSVNKRIEIRDRATTTVLQSRSYSLTESEFGLSRLIVKPTNVTIYPNGLASSPFNIYTFAGPTGRAIRVRRTGHIRVTAP